MWSTHMYNSVNSTLYLDLKLNLTYLTLTATGLCLQECSSGLFEARESAFRPVRACFRYKASTRSDCERAIGRNRFINSCKFVVVMRAETTGYVTAPDVKSFSMCDGPKMVSIIVMCTD